MPNTPNQQFYVVGGTVNPDSPSYVVRQADQELFDRVMAGDFCYVLTSRQMGKSSLMARAAKRLSEAGLHTAIVDLTQIGTEKEKQSADQWYYGIAHRILRELSLRDVDLNQWWQSRSSLPALQRLTEFFSDLLLERVAGQIVIFIDEIDSTISLPFTDDFFAAIRACYNARATEADYKRLGFVLLGVAGPSDLMKDSTRTPFNIGHRIELTDFTIEEAKPLVAGLSAIGRDGEQVLRCILDWTGGHPYLTQKLCQTIQYRDREGAAITDQGIGSLVEQSFLSQTASREDSNLNFVRDWLTGDKKLSGKVFKLYHRIHRDKPVADAPLSPVQNHLKLSGVVALRPDHTLRVRNRVYERVFTAEWAKKMMPVNWGRRAVFASAAAMLLTGLSILNQLQVAQRRLQVAARRQAYAAAMRQASDDLANRNIGRMNEILEHWVPKVGEEDLRGYEWYYLWRLSHFEPGVLAGHIDRVYSVAFSPDSARLATASGDRTVKLWDVKTSKPLNTLVGHIDQVLHVVFSPDGQLLASSGNGGSALVWDVSTGRLLWMFASHNQLIHSVTFSPDGKTLATGSDDSTITLWDTATGAVLRWIAGHGREVRSVAFAPDGRMLASGSVDGTIKLWELATGRELATLAGHTSLVWSVAFSRDGRRLLSGSADHTAKLWDLTTRQNIRTFTGHANEIFEVAISPDGKRFATASGDHTIKIWDAETGLELLTFREHTDQVWSVTFSSDGRMLASGSWDRTARLWHATSEEGVTERLRK